MVRIPDIDDVRAAAKRIAGHARLTPLLAGTPLDALTGGKVLLKLETLQHTGSFKFRGAWNRLSQLGAAERAAGVVAFSSGNHAQGVAEAARRLGIRATIVMPSDAPAMKMRNTLAMGAEVVQYDRVRESREEIAARLAAERGATLVPSFDDPDVIAGQGTVGLEIAEQAAALGATLDDMIVCCQRRRAHRRDRALCLRSLRRRHACIRPSRRTMTITAARSSPGAVNATSPARRPRSVMRCWRRCRVNSRSRSTRDKLRGGLTVSDDEVRRAIAFASRTLKLTVEPGGAVALASVLAGKLDVRERTVALTLSGGNIDDAMLADILRRESA